MTSSVGEPQRGGRIFRSNTLTSNPAPLLRCHTESGVRDLRPRWRRLNGPKVGDPEI